MIKVARRWTKGIVLFILCFSSLEGASFEEQRKNKMLGDLEVIKHILEIEYAPKDWKRSYAGWDLDQALAHSKSQVLNNKKITTKQFQQVVKDFLGSTQDYHVNAYFLSTEWSTLPFAIKGANGRYFIDWIDTRRLSSSVYSIAVGDELLKFDGRPVDEVINELKSNAGRFANPQTDQSLAEMCLTFRSGQRGDVVPKGPVNISVRSVFKGDVYSYQLMWNYHPEHIHNPFDLPGLNTAMAALTIDSFKKKKSIQRKSFFNPVAKLYCPTNYTGRGIGSYKSFLPELGSLIWSVDDESPYYAYIYQNSQGKKIGYIRIPHYKSLGSEVECFGEIIGLFQDATDALVIDQLDNPGGYVENQYVLASMLTDYPLQTPKHRLMINQQDILEAFEILSILEQIQTDEDAESIFWGSGIFKTYQYVLFLKDYYHFIIKQWNEGRVLTDPIHIEGVDQINPHPRYRYTKPILILINQLDFSGGDFFPAIMQDNKRAVLFGARTAGAGGYVKVFDFPNSHGLAGFTYTASIAERLDKQPIENLGVTPDIAYQVTEEDLQYTYQPYLSRVNQVINALLSPSTK
jgi:hypothetical protein